jgi:hypothetical protein
MLQKCMSVQYDLTSKCRAAAPAENGACPNGSLLPSHLLQHVAYSHVCLCSVALPRISAYLPAVAAGFDFSREVLQLRCIRQSDPAAWTAMVRYFPARCRAAMDADANAAVRSGALEPPAAAAVVSSR